MGTRLVVLALALAACGEKRFGRVVTDVVVDPARTDLLQVAYCELVDAGKRDVARVRLTGCGRYRLRRSAITPTPVADVGVAPLDGRILTDLRERPGGGAIATTCRVALDGDTYRLTECATIELSTAAP